MPLYEYKCENCGEQFEVIQKFSDPLVEKCPKCGRGPVHKLLSSPAIQFKGSGWYITDYARKSDSKTDSTRDSGAEAKSDGTGASTDKSAKKSDKSDAKTGKTKSGTTESSGASPSKPAADPVK
jgi:putative FmdB family regulatory protein